MTKMDWYAVKQNNELTKFFSFILSNIILSFFE